MILPSIITFRNLIILPLLLVATFVNAQGDFEVQPGSSTSGCGPLIVNFESLPDGAKTVESYLWDLGNGTNSILEKPGTVYTTDGKYNVQLVISYTDGSSETINKPDLIEVYEGPTVDFTSNVSSGCFPLTIDFTNTSIAGDTTLDSSKTIWQFGEDGVAMGENPSFTFTQSGEYDVKLFVEDENGCKSAITKPGFITVSSPVEANFYPSKYTIMGDSANADFILSLPDSTDSSNLLLEWDFDNDGTYDSTGDSTTYNFNRIGDSTFYDVRLRVTNLNTGCSDDTLMVNAVKMYEPDYDIPFQYGTDFEGSPREYSCPPAALSFNIQPDSDKEVFNQLWVFGDGTTGTFKNPVHIYTDPGKYDTKLTVYYSDGSIETVIKNNYVEINGPKPAFTASEKKGYFPLTVTFKNYSTENDGNELDTAGTSWSLGNGEIIRGYHDSLTYTFTQPGIYSPGLSVRDVYGCENVAILDYGIEVIGFQPDFLIEQSPVCEDVVQVTFVDNTPPPFDSSNFVLYEWDFGDGSPNVFGDSRALHVYQLFGDTTNIEVKLKITHENGGSESVSKTLELIKPQIDFQADENFGASPFTTSFSPDLDYPADSKILSWDFDGDGVVDTVAREPWKTFYNHTDDTLFYDVTLYLK
ncbi:MAG: PKD domain-containing protein, partial [Flammeovirgaceae bacterium]|nr:PKD domain-containing protein [Flammeovirgaceae bacterium]